MINDNYGIESYYVKKSLYSVVTPGKDKTKEVVYLGQLLYEI